jgi:hypothetical protein
MFEAVAWLAMNKDTAAHIEGGASFRYYSGAVLCESTYNTIAPSIKEVLKGP